jgi:cystatin-A/B
MFGGPGAAEDADEEIKKIAKGMKENAEKALGETYTEFEAVKFTRQIVNGTNYNIKVKVGGEKYIHIKVHVPLPNKNEANKLLEQHKDKTLADPL